MNAAGLSNAAIAMPHNATHPVMTSPAALYLPANDAIGRRPAPQAAAPAPRRREAEVEAPATQEPVTIASPDAVGATMPLETYRGIAVSVERCDGEPMFQLTLQHQNEEHSVPAGLRDGRGSDRPRMAGLGEGAVPASDRDRCGRQRSCRTQRARRAPCGKPLAAPPRFAAGGAPVPLRPPPPGCAAAVHAGRTRRASRTTARSSPAPDRRD